VRVRLCVCARRSVRSEEEVKKKLRRRAKRIREKQKGDAAEAADAAGATEDADAAPVATVADEFAALLPLRAESKIRSFSFSSAVKQRDGHPAVEILLSLHDNTGGSLHSGLNVSPHARNSH
jgi:U3 small nucleolar RNA-associated protein 12